MEEAYYEEDIIQADEQEEEDIKMHTTWKITDGEAIMMLLMNNGADEGDVEWWRRRPLPSGSIGIALFLRKGWPVTCQISQN